MDWFDGLCVGVIFLMVGIYFFIFMVVQDKPIADSSRTYYGSQQPIYINGQFFAVYEPITSELRKPTLTDKLYYGELD
jgi:hypothetical protein